MRIRIVRPPPVRDVDGIAVGAFEVGREYEVGPSLGALFLAERWAEPVAPARERSPREKRVIAAHRVRKAAAGRTKGIRN
jgi:hypothetical protein